jgi:hypothetical protein
MSDQSKRQEQPAQTAPGLKQRVLDQLETGKKAIEELSNEELEAVAGGFVLATTSYPSASMDSWTGVKPMEIVSTAQVGSPMIASPMTDTTRGSKTNEASLDGTKW